MNNILEDIKLSLDITDDLQDKLIESLINRTESAIKAYIGTTSIPNELTWVVTDAVIVRIGLLGNEAKESDSLEGYSSTYKNDSLSDFYHYLDVWKYEHQTNDKSNSVRFF